MKKTIYILILCLISHFAFGQDFERKIFDYNQMPDTDTTVCHDAIIERLNKVLGLIESLQSEKSAELAKEIFEKSEKCPQLYEVYSWALFRSGKWMESISIIDSAIILYGSNPDLILRRGYENIEMADLGVGTRKIDGNSVYLPESKRLDYNDSTFMRQNYLAALSDFKYISDKYQERFQEIYITGYIYQKLENYGKSTEYLSKLLENEEYADETTLLIVDNHIGEKDFTKAENTLKNLEKKHPKNAKIQNKFSQLYELSGQKDKLRISRLKSEYYSWVPEYCVLEYSQENYETIRFFLEDNSPKQKVKKLKEIRKQYGNTAIDVFIAILNTHANHGNGVEEETEKLLIEIGDSVVPKVILLMQNAPSTCTVTKAASILAELKDPRGWQPLIDYLPRMENIPFTLIPPEVPAQIIKFDKEKGLRALLEWIKGQIETEKTPSDNPLDELGGMFASTSIYSPLSVYKKEDIRKVASELKYSNEQVDKLIIKIFGQAE
jgi:tetratricopeptide (TPR) repeat protein